MRPPFQLSNAYDDGPARRQSLKPTRLAPAPAEVDLNGPIHLLVRDPELMGKTWTLEMDPESTVADLIHAFLVKKFGEPVNHGCQLRMALGSVQMHEELDRTILSFGFTRQRSLVSSSWKASANGCVTPGCSTCHKIRTSVPRLLTTNVASAVQPSKIESKKDKENAPRKKPTNATAGSPGVVNPKSVRTIASAVSEKKGGATQLVSELEKLVNTAHIATDIAGQLERLSALEKDGSINEEEFAQAKRKVLGAPVRRSEA